MPVDPVVHVVDDDDSLRRAITRLLEAAGHSACGYANAAEFLAGAWRDAPGCLLLDIQLPGKSGMELQEALFQSPSPLPNIFLTGRADVPMSVRAMKLGAVDFLMKPVTSEVLLTAVRIALARDAENRAQRERLRDLRACYEQLTPREKEVLVHLGLGLCDGHRRLHPSVAQDRRHVEPDGSGALHPAQRVRQQPRPVAPSLRQRR